MIAKRLAAAALAIALIAGAWIVRDRVIEGDGNANADEGKNAGLLVCASELASMCRAVAGDRIEVLSQPAGQTLDTLTAADAEPVLWLTFDVFPEMMNEARVGAGLDGFTYSTRRLASSPISVVAETRRAGGVVDACGDPVDLACFDGTVSAYPAVSPIDTGIGLLSIAALINARTDGAVQFQDTALLSWSRGLRRAQPSALQSSGDTAVQTMQLRPIPVAIGAEAELVPAQRDRFEVLYAAPMARVNVVLMQPRELSVPDGLVADLSDQLETRGWVAPVDSEPGALPPAVTLLGIRAFWKGLQ